MKNGLNIGGVSEYVHEIRLKPVEAGVRFGAKAVQWGPGLTSVDIATIQVGSVRAARDFRLGAGAHGDVGIAPTSIQYLLGGLSGCAMNTLVQGLSARGITIRKLELEARCLAPNDGSGPVRDVAYDVMLDADTSDEMVEEMIKFVSCFSPNHRTFLEANEIELQLIAADGSTCNLTPQFSPAVESRAGMAPVQARFAWRYGTQLGGSTWLEGKTPIPLRVDQAKQYLGLDWAPNPQEYVLTALSTQLLNDCEAALRARGLEGGLKVTAYGWLDMRGITNVDKTVPVRMHGLKALIAVPESLQLKAVEDAARTAIATWSSGATVCLPSSIHVTGHTPRGKVAEFRSDSEFVSQYLTLVAERERAASERR
jgi:uncharacterized OsmC-like protein